MIAEVSKRTGTVVAGVAGPEALTRVADIFLSARMIRWTRSWSWESEWKMFLFAFSKKLKSLRKRNKAKSLAN